MNKQGERIFRIMALILAVAATICMCVSCGKTAETATEVKTTEGKTAESKTTGTTEKKTIEKIYETDEETLTDIDRTWPYVTGGFVQPDPFMNYEVADWENHFAGLKEVGIDTFIIQWTAVTPNGKYSYIYYPSEAAKDNKAGSLNDCSTFLPRVLEAAEKSGIKVFVGLNLSDEWWEKGCSDAEWNATEASVGTQMANEIYSLYKEEYPNALHGWYFAYEMYNGMLQDGKNAGDFLNMYLEPLTKLDASMPLMLSPFVTSSGGSAAKAGEEWTKVFEVANFREGDIFCCQDAVGAGHIKIEMLDGYFSNLKKAVDTEKGLLFWANSEDFTLENGNYSSAGVSRFAKQMEIAKPYVSGYVTFAYSHYYAKDYDSKGGFHRAYKHYYNTGISTSEVEAPTLGYDDAGGRLFINTSVKNNEIGIQTLTYSIKGKDDYVYKVPLEQLGNAEITARYMFLPDPDATKLEVTVTATDYYGASASNKIEIELK